MLKSSLSGYSDAYILARWTITITGEQAAADKAAKILCTIQWLHRQSKKCVSR